MVTFAVFNLYEIKSRAFYFDFKKNCVKFSILLLLTHATTQFVLFTEKILRSGCLVEMLDECDYFSKKMSSKASVEYKST